MVRRLVYGIVAGAMVAALLACSQSAPSSPHATTLPPAPMASALGSERTAYGFFPSPPKPTLESVLDHFAALSEHADFVLLQPNVPWEDFLQAPEGESKSREDLRNQVTLARMNGLEWVFVVDPLNGLNRREFFGLPQGWEPSFANPDVRAAFMNFSLWIMWECEPRYLGLASEINTYMDAHPEDDEHYLSLYQETYDRVKTEFPDTRLFVTFQWDDLNNMFPPAAEGRARYATNWGQVEVFEPRLDLWAISSYPYLVFHGGESIPRDYCTPLLGRTDKPIAVAEGGFASRAVGPIQVDADDQVAYLQAIHDQLGERLAFWVYILLDDLNMDAIGEMMREQGRPEGDIDTLGMLAPVGLRESDGTSKPALAVWDRYRIGE